MMKIMIDKKYPAETCINVHNHAEQICHPHTDHTLSFNQASYSSLFWVLSSCNLSLPEKKQLKLLDIDWIQHVQSAQALLYQRYLQALHHKMALVFIE